MSANPSLDDAGRAQRSVVAARRGRGLRVLSRTLLWLLLAASGVLFACWLSLHWLILPHIDEWRVPIETRAGSLLGAPVRIGAIAARSSGWVPAVELRDVRVLDAEGRIALALPKVYAALSARSLLALELRFDQLLIDGASLDIRRDVNGRIRVAGLDVGTAGTGEDDDAVADWFFHQHEVVIRGGTLRWLDDARQAPPLALGDVELVVRNGLRRHELRLDATPPAGWGDRFSLRGVFAQPIFARSGDWRRWSGSAYADLPRADVRELRRHVALPFELSEGDGALRGWFDVKDGEPTGATVDVSLRAVSLRLAADVEPLQFAQVEGRIGAERIGKKNEGDRIAVAVRRFGFVTGDGVQWPQGDLDIAWNRNDAGAVIGGEFSADRLDVGVMAQIATRVPLGKALRQLLANVAPEGVITRLATRWDGPLDAPEHYRVKGMLSKLSLQAKPAARSDEIGRPGLRNAAVELVATEAGGEARVGIEAGALDLPGVFAERELPLDRFDARLAWNVEAGRRGEPANVAVQVGNATFANADARGELSGSWHTGKAAADGSGRYPGELLLDGRLVEARADRTARYLPLGLPESVRDYVGRAVRGGSFASVDLRVRGDLRDFPFHDVRRGRDGELRIVAKVRDMTLAYIPDAAGVPAEERWPPLTAVSGELVIDRDALQIRAATARLSGVAWSGIQGRIAPLAGATRLDIEGNARGPLADMLRFVNTTPVRRWSAGALAETTATGPAELKLALAVPLDHPDVSTARVDLVLAGNDVRMTADTPLLGAARARVEVTEKGFAVTAARAQVLGGELAFEGGSGTSGDGVQRFTGQGTFTAEALRQAKELGTVARLGDVLGGQGSYRASLTFAGSRPQIELASDLVGIGIDLPAPLGKTAATPLALTVRTGPESGGGTPSSSPRESIQVALGGALQAHVLREGSGEAARIVRGAVRIGEQAGAASADTLVLPARGVAASLALKRLDIGEWQAAAEKLQASARRSAAAGPALPPAVEAASDDALPDTVSLNVGELETGSRRLRNVVATLTRQGALWRADVTADELAGRIEYRPARAGAAAPAGRVYARLSRLSLPGGEAERVESLLEEQPASIPSLDIVVDDFELRGKRLGRLEVEAANRAVVDAGLRETAREWQLSKLRLVMPEAQFAATGTWGAVSSPGPAGPKTVPRQAAIDFQLTLADSGALLERLGMGRVVRGGKGVLSGAVAWPGSPLSPDYARMTGQVKVAIESGQFLKASPGAARLLGVLSLQSLPRRLSLDFRDVFAEGFAFDDVVGDVRIGQGLAATNNLRMRGAAAAVLMEGNADLERETQDLRVVVVPQINAGTAALAFAVINPAVGLGAFLAQYFLSKPLSAASTREFHVTGPWDDPKVERVERSPAKENPP